MTALAPYTVEAPGRASAEAAALWLALPAEERERTAIYAAGGRLRAGVNAAVQDGLAARGGIGPARMEVQVLSRLNLTDEELRSARAYATGTVVEIDRAIRSQGRPAGLAPVESVDARGNSVTLSYPDGNRRVFIPERLKPRDGRGPVALYERRTISLHKRDRICWTANDLARGLFNADQATVLRIADGRVEIATSDGRTVILERGDPTLARLDLAYAVNAHMAQGLTADRGIAVIETRDTKLVNHQTYLVTVTVTVTRVRDALTLVVDRAGTIERPLMRNPGGKTSAREGARDDQRLPPEKNLDMEPGGIRPYDMDI